jgi:vanillate monooxygenase
MPVFEFFDNPAWAYGGGLYHVKADYRLMIDNLMDLTHETYVHANSIGQPEIDETPSETKVTGDQVVLQRHMQGIQAPPFWQMAMSANGLDPQAKVDRWQICRFTPPSHIMIDVGVALAGKGGFDARTLSTRPTAWWWTSSRPRPKPRTGTTGAWRASSSPKTRR